MHVLVTNDDGILAEGLWVLAGELKKIAEVTVVAPDRERSAIGTAVTLRHPLRVKPVKSPVPGTAAYSVDGTPSDSVILALGRLVADKADFVVSGINHGSNLGDDVHISGTVGAAMQGYLRGCPAVSVSVPREDETLLDAAAKVTAILVKRMGEARLPPKIFLNLNLPDLPPDEIKGVRITRLARESHINTVEEGSHGRQRYYWLDRAALGGAAGDGTDLQAIGQGHISVTAIYFHHADRPPTILLESLCDGLLEELRKAS